MDTIENLPDFLSRLQAKKIHYTTVKTRDDHTMVRIEVRGERWDIDFFPGGKIEVAVFRMSGGVNSIDSGIPIGGKLAPEALERLFNIFPGPVA